ncbi:Rv1733c family protein [Streptomyces fructofermentans]|uniref:Integral membrane protein n=1 Tax=Streptomyces fructofermentans TaxID=152141 RepID=A0A918NAJ1_9ACTN|nr:hypothetical protein [Streptomyces fructofermentans]GGX58500.1 hypothetical protein GCM10010515_27650 [Streptomyces fructofermentans]
MRAIWGLRHWRDNPLRRATDLAEAWLALAALLLILVAAPLAGTLVGGRAHDALQRSAREQREDRHPLYATVVRKADRTPLDPDPETASGRDSHSRVLALWTAPDGTARRGTVMAALNSPQRGDRFTLWTDGHGRVVGEPLDPAAASAHAALAGFGTAALCAGLIEGSRRLVVWRMVRRRYDGWDRAWSQAGPDWGRTGTGS